MAIIVGDDIYNNRIGSANLDANYGPWDNVTQAWSELQNRGKSTTPGVTVGIKLTAGGVKEYWVQPIGTGFGLVEKGLSSESASKVRGVFGTLAQAQSYMTELKGMYQAGDTSLAGAKIICITSTEADHIAVYTLDTTTANNPSWVLADVPLTLRSAIRTIQVRTNEGTNRGDQVAEIVIDGGTPISIYAPASADHTLSTVLSLAGSVDDNQVPTALCVKTALATKANSADVGTLSNLNTTEKTTIVGAINEVAGDNPTIDTTTMADSDTHVPSSKLTASEIAKISAKVGEFDLTQGSLASQLLGSTEEYYEQFGTITNGKCWNTSNIDVGNVYTGINKTESTRSRMKISVLQGEKYKIYCGSSAGQACRQYMLTYTDSEGVENVVYQRGGYSNDYRTTPLSITIAHDGYMFVNFDSYRAAGEYDGVAYGGDRVEKANTRNVGGYKAYVDEEITESEAYAVNAVNSAKQLSGKSIVLIGDSQIGTLTSAFDTEVARVTGATVYNCGFGGMRYTDTYNDALHKAFCMIGVTDALTSGDFSAMDASVSDGSGHFVPHLANLKSVYAALQGTEGDGFIMTIEYGSNDFANSQPLGSHGNVNTTSVLGAQEYAINNLLTAYPQLKIVIVGLPWRVESYSTIEGVKTITSTSDDFTRSIGGQTMHRVDYSDAILWNANTYYHLPTFDYYRNCGRNAYNAFMVGADGCHPTNRFGSLLAADYYIKLLTSTK